MYLVVQLIGGFTLVGAVIMLLGALTGDMPILPTIGVAVTGALLVLLGKMAEDLHFIRKFFQERDQGSQ